MEEEDPPCQELLLQDSHKEAMGELTNFQEIPLPFSLEIGQKEKNF